MAPLSKGTNLHESIRGIPYLHNREKAPIFKLVTGWLGKGAAEAAPGRNSENGSVLLALTFPQQGRSAKAQQGQAGRLGHYGLLIDVV
jgi:hypothetical protein